MSTPPIHRTPDMLCPEYHLRHFLRKALCESDEEDFFTLRMGGVHCMKWYEIWVVIFYREDDTIITDKTLKELYLKDMFITNIWEVLPCLYKNFSSKNISSHKSILISSTCLSCIRNTVVDHFNHF